MLASVKCPHCRKQHRVRPQAGGRLVRCSGCKEQFRLPEQEILANLAAKAAAQSTAAEPPKAPPPVPKRKKSADAIPMAKLLPTAPPAAPMSPPPAAAPVGPALSDQPHDLFGDLNASDGIYGVQPETSSGPGAISSSDFDDYMADASAQDAVQRAKDAERTTTASDDDFPHRYVHEPVRKKDDDGDMPTRLYYAAIAFLVAPGLIALSAVLWLTCGVPMKLMFIAVFVLAIWPLMFGGVLDPKIPSAFGKASDTATPLHKAAFAGLVVIGIILAIPVVLVLLWATEWS